MSDSHPVELRQILEFHANSLCAYLATMGLEEMTIGASMIRGPEDGQNYCVIVMKDDSLTDEDFESDDSDQTEEN